MPLMQSKSKKAFKKNVETEMKSGKPQDQSLAIAYSVKRKNKKKMAQGGLARGVKQGIRDMRKTGVEGSSTRSIDREDAEKGIHKISGTGKFEGRSDAGNAVRSGEHDLHQDAKEMHKKVLAESRFMSKPKLQGLYDGGLVDENDQDSINHNSAIKAAKDDSWSDRSTVAQAQKPSRVPLKHPKMVPSNAFSVRMRDEEDDLQKSAGVNDGPQEQPPKTDDEMDAKKSGPDVPALHMKRMAKGGMINEEVSMKDAEEDEVVHPAGLEEDDDQMGDKDAMADHMKMLAEGGPVSDEEDDEVRPDKGWGKVIIKAKGGLVHEMDEQPQDEEMEEHYSSIAAAIMAKRDRESAMDSGSADEDQAERYAEGGMIKSHDSIYSDDSSQADLSRNADEDANEEDQLSFNALRKENYSESEGLKQLDSPMDSNEHGHELSDEDAHDMVSKIRAKMNMHRQFKK